MFTVNVTHLGAGGISVSFPQSAGEESEAHAEETLDEGPSPIAPELKELLWGFGAFAVFLILMRLWLVPKVKRGMESRYGAIQGQHESADAVRAAAHADVAAYEAALAGVRAEAAARIDAARGERIDDGLVAGDPEARRQVLERITHSCLGARRRRGQQHDQPSERDAREPE